MRTNSETDPASRHAPRLAQLVMRRLESDPAVTPDIAHTILTALGDLETSEPTAEFGAAGIFLRAIRVRGFRGIGAETTLELAPGPGLTLVVGRNGSGKSSFAEAAELALTGGNRRWDGRSAAWREGWRNLHEPEPARIQLELLAGGERPQLTVTKEWSPGAALSEARWTQRTAAGRAPFPARRWSVPLELYRPFLSYSELGALVDGKPSELFDALHQLLGLDELTVAQETIRMRRLELERAARDSRQERLELLAELAAVADDRAVRMTELLRPPAPDLTAVDGELFGADTGGEPDGLRAIVRLRLPAESEVAEIAARLTECGAALDRDATADAEADLRILELLIGARDHAAVVSPCPCPVCGRGTLDADWSRAADASITALTDRVAALAGARDELDGALRAARALPEQLPTELAFDPRNPPSVDTAAVRRAWSEWAALTDTDYTHDLPGRLLAAHARLVDELELLQQGTRKELDRLDEVWAPLTPRIAAWLDGARDVAAHADELRTTRKAEEWLKAATAGLRGERMAPLETTARWVWHSLRQQSNVELGGIRLQGNVNTARRVLLDVTVDEVDGAALGVMSQGELHALGLSLFLPRATVEDSPFRFVMIDDPVQAMDPAKVDGLARVLATVAWTRQVVVFTHDERLAEAVRRMQIDARVLEVQRRERSRVEVRVSGDPVLRYLDDARALTRTPQLPPAIADELVATCCRSALEAASLARARRELLADGVDHREVQRLIDTAQSTRAMVALAVLGPSGRIEELGKHLARVGKWAVGALRDATAGAHVPIGRSMHDLIADTEKLVDWLAR
ncbi:AAA family ATPase [Nocardia cyriacigeorgica]|uniref:Nuclease SbcCD subunit C n=1 Tax=Nocardia cyriacigeorgica TaxID=135487 RepID=A0A6P1D4P0_9NOCA|nr:AAA family ATPase [Nocardia cyriacigeorgica]NEW40370.1 AAA family ATPase [Nocardia cyriacigeorgica]NEW45575.1 AAA family ATPase [Nocardia cyriacigeorgica]NEW50682.1 AAA family ATPase [Nocardia cyriacigeorgica]NEW54830.1 AAA family ATPase [Nocardia cyriacigeorgica]